LTRVMEKAAERKQKALSKNLRQKRNSSLAKRGGGIIPTASIA
jgi:hypothetical protein